MPGDDAVRARGVCIFQAAVAALMVGCGGGSASAPEEQSGVLQAGGVAGVMYATATRNGVTDAAGTFKYLPGETVIFSVGGIELGRAPGAPAITLFTLAGSTPPTTEPALRRELDRAVRARTPFVRAMNLQRLLMALDADHDPSNGMDVRDRNAELVNASLDFDLRVADFAARLNRLAPRLTRNIPHWMPAVQLYRGIGISITAHEEVRRESVNNLGIRSVATKSYSAQGLHESSTHDDEGDGDIDLATFESFDALGRTLTARVNWMRSWATAAHLSSSSTHSYDARGNPIRVRTEIDDGINGSIDSASVGESTFDAGDRLESETLAVDYGFDGIVDQRIHHRYVYDVLGDSRVLTTTIDSDSDGVADSRTVQTVRHDLRDRLQAYEYEEDVNADGIVDRRQWQEVEWSTNGLSQQINVYLDIGADGSVDSTSLQVFEMDRSGHLRRYFVEGSNYGSPAPAQSYEHMMQRDSDGRVVADTQTYRDIESGEVELVIHGANIYDAQGNRLEHRSDYDYGNDGIVDANYRHFGVYGVNGELFEERSTDDFDADGVPDAQGSSLVACEPVANGVALLAQKYFQFAAAAAAAAF
jgi:hypothetical protein